MEKIVTRPAMGAEALGTVCLTAAGLAGAVGHEGPCAVLIQDGRIKAIGQEALDAGALVHDLGDKWLCPAPIDAHVHLSLGGEPADNLAAWEKAGVAAVRDLGHSPNTVLPQPANSAPLLSVAGMGLGAIGPGSCWLADRLAGPQEFEAAARARVKSGATALKVFASGLLDFQRPGRVEHPLAVSEEEMSAVARVAHDAGLPLVVHASGEDTVRAAMAAGADAIEHGFFLGEETLWDMATQGVSLTPTVAAVWAHAKDSERRHAPFVRRNLGRMARTQERAMYQAESVGVNLVLGTDAGSYGLAHGAALFVEMRAWLEAGLKPQTVFEACTKRAAEAVGLEGELGVLAPGSRCWLLACEGDPAESPLLMDGAEKLGWPGC